MPFDKITFLLHTKTVKLRTENKPFYLIYIIDMQIKGYFSEQNITRDSGSHLEQLTVFMLTETKPYYQACILLIYEYHHICKILILFWCSNIYLSNFAKWIVTMRFFTFLLANVETQPYARMLWTAIFPNVLFFILILNLVEGTILGTSKTPTNRMKIKCLFLQKTKQWTSFDMMTNISFVLNYKQIGVFTSYDCLYTN